MNTYLSNQTLKQIYLAVTFPCLATDRLKIKTSHDSNNFSHPCIVVARNSKGLNVVGVDKKAAHAGLLVGMSLVEARSLCRELNVFDADYSGDKIYLTKLARDAERFTPAVGYSLPNGLILDVTGCTHLFGGPEAILATVQQHYHRYGLEANVAMASNPTAARAFARCGKNRHIHPANLIDELHKLPLTALDLPHVITGLRRAGFHSLGDIYSLSPKVLAARFGETLPMRLSNLYGERHVPISPIQPLPIYRSLQRFAEPILSQEALIMTLMKMAHKFFTGLKKYGVGCRILDIDFFRVDGAVSKLSIETRQPLLDVGLFLQLLQEKLSSLAAPLDIGCGFDAFSLSLRRHEKLQDQQTDFFETEDNQPLGHLLDRLATRLGTKNIGTAHLNPSHIPEEAAFWTQGVDEQPKTITFNNHPIALERPFRIFCPPQPIDVVVRLPDTPPISFRWRRMQHKIRLAEGPERISAEWWKKASPLRDYYRLEDENGQRFWVFRQGLHDKTTVSKSLASYAA